MEGFNWGRAKSATHLTDSIVLPNLKDVQDQLREFV